MERKGERMPRQELSYKTLYAKTIKRNICILALLFACAFLLTILSLMIGQAKISFANSVKGLFGAGEYVRIVRYVRLPRVCAALAVGFGLAISGCVMQVILQNPLASPSSLGVSQSAVFGANLAIVFGAGAFAGTGSSTLNINDPFVVALSALAFSVATVFAVVGVSKFKSFSPVTVILLGVAASGFFTALTTLVQYMASDQVLAAAVYWSFGDLSRATYSKIAIMAACIIPSFVVFMLLRWKYNAIGNGDEVASSLGVRLSVVRVVSLLLASLITAVCVSFVGVIGFVGIVSPQLLKRFMGGDMRFLLPASGLFGCCLLLLSDLLARVVVSGMDLPVGAVTAVLGTPIFVYILLRKEKGVRYA